MPLQGPVLCLKDGWLDVAIEKYGPNLNRLSESSREGISLYF